MPGMSAEVAALTHAEMIRRREDQHLRVASVRSRATGILGASGLAATLVSAVGDNGGYVVAVICYVFATVYSVKSMWMTTLHGRSPEGLIDDLKSMSEDHARIRIVMDIVNQIVQNEERLRAIGKDTAVAMGWFLAGTVLTALVAGITVLLTIRGG
ncbi:hypothetical protein [Microbacterium arborescens]